MKNDALTSPGLLPNAGRLHAEVVKAISYIEVQRDLLNAPPSQGKALDVWINDILGYLSEKQLIDYSAPTVSTRVVLSTSQSILRITYNETLDATVVPATSAFVVSGNTVTAVQISGNTVLLALGTPITADGQTVAYTQPGTNGVRNISGVLAASFTAAAVDHQTV